MVLISGHLSCLQLNGLSIVVIIIIVAAGLYDNLSDGLVVLLLLNAFTVSCFSVLFVLHDPHRLRVHL